MVEVFTPSVPASRGFVGRETEVKDLRKKGLRVPGAQVVVWGESGAGKSSLVNKALIDEGLVAVKTPCTPGATYDEILASAFAGTGAFYVTESAEHTEGSVTLGGTIGSDLIGAKATIQGQFAAGSGITKQPIARPQLSPQRLAAELGRLEYSWVIEDFHKLDEAERVKVAHALKVFSDEGAKYPSTRVIVLGVSDSVDELVADSTNVGSRLIDIHVPPLGHDELGKILDVGGGILNLDFSVIRTSLLETAVGTASVTHALALACCDERDIEQAAEDRVTFTNEDFQEAAQSYVRTRSGTVRSRFRSALKVHRKRIYDNTELILRALAQLPESGGTVGEIVGIIRLTKPNYPSSNATKYLRELQEEERGSLVRKTSAGVYRFDEPLQHAYAKAFFGPMPKAVADRITDFTMWESAVEVVFTSWLATREEFEAARDAMDGDDDEDEEPTDG
ncbi:ATP-binding protein [Microbacterium sp. As-52]|uniref:ATP-binding protein n=1 Tax=Microbacterium sp. As-52 TaxID=3390503 RepID=UPI003CE8ACA7